jgi:hypothetical protein
VYTPVLSPRASLLSFVRYVACQGLQKAAHVSKMRRAAERESGFNPQARLFSAFKRDLQFGTAGQQLDDLCGQATANRAMYQALRPGLTEVLLHLPTGPRSVLPLHEVTCVRSGLPIKIRGHVGVEYADGTREVLWFWCDPTPLSETTLAVVMTLLAQHIDDICAGAAPAVVDVRRSAIHRTVPRNVSAKMIETYVASEAASFAAGWSAAA